MIRPAGVSRSATVLVAVGVALFLIARTTGSGWLVVLLSGMAAALVVSFVLPVVSLWGVGIDARGPRHATAGRPFPLTVSVSGRGRDLRLRARGLVGPAVAVDAPAEGTVALQAKRRGVLRQVTIEVRCAWPLGLVAWRRLHVHTLDPPVEVGPLPIEVPLPHRAAAVTLGSESVRSVRDYAIGDPLRFVHWPATARAGVVMVKEMDAPARPEVAIVADLRGPVDLAEDAAGRTAGLVLAALAAGIAVTLLTAEADGPAVGPVLTPVEVGRRLARAIDTPPPSGPVPAGATIVVVAAP